MSAKEKILVALDEMLLDDLSTERLVDVLVDEMKRLREKNADIAVENEAERVRLRDLMKSMQHEREQMRDNPLWGARGAFKFEIPWPEKGEFVVEVQSGKVLRATLFRDGIGYTLANKPR